MSPLRARSDAIRLRRARLHGAPDGLRARRRLEAALADATPSASDVGARAILIVRRVAPATRLRLDPLVGADAFKAAVRAELAGQARRAVRPWRDPGAAGDAALFDDEAELLACMLLDFARGALAGRWWAAALLDGASPADWLRNAALPRGDLLPAALALLSARRCAAEVVARLSDAEAMAALDAIASAHALPAAVGALRVSPILQTGETQRSPAPVAPPRAAEPDIAAFVHEITAIAPELRATLSAMQRRLLLFAVALARAPGWARTAEFQRDVERVERVLIAQDPLAARLWETKDEASSQSRAQALPRRPKPKPSSASARSDRARVVAAQPPPEEPARSINHAPAAAHMEHKPGISQESPQAPKREQQRLRRVADRESYETYAAPPMSRDEAAAIAAPHVLRDAPAQSRSIVETRFGGVLFLMNAALALGLYGDFSQPKEPGLPLPPWDLLALIGRAWFGRAFEDDPLWALLAQLSGRSPTQTPTTDALDAQDWRMPAQWLAPWGETRRLSLRARAKRLQLWHEAGFIIVETARGRAPATAQAQALLADRDDLQRARLVRIYAAPRRTRRGGGASRGGRWLRLLLLYLEARLRSALGVDAAVDLLCRYDARLFLSATALDAEFSLAALPIEVRIAGLDRDPGWIPAAGRTLAFHFR